MKAGLVRLCSSSTATAILTVALALLFALMIGLTSCQGRWIDRDALVSLEAKSNQRGSELVTLTREVTALQVSNKSLRDEFIGPWRKNLEKLTTVLTDLFEIERKRHEMDCRMPESLPTPQPWPQVPTPPTIHPQSRIENFANALALLNELRRE